VRLLSFDAFQRFGRPANLGHRLEGNLYSAGELGLDGLAVPPVQLPTLWTIWLLENRGISRERRRNSLLANRQRHPISTRLDIDYLFHNISCWVPTQLTITNLTKCPQKKRKVNKTNVGNKKSKNESMLQTGIEPAISSLRVMRLTAWPLERLMSA
jgi:hypothetical protein